MAVNANGRWIGFGVGDPDPINAKPGDPNYHAVSLINEKLYDRFQATHPLGLNRIKSVYDEVTAAAVSLIADNYGMTIPVDAQGFAVANLAFRTKIGAYPPPPPPTHCAFTVRGTGGVVGDDYTSLIARALPGAYHEHPILYDATMGGIPVGVASSGPSGNACADQVEQLLEEAVTGSTVTFSIFAYSLGCKGVIQFLNRLFGPTDPLYVHRNRLVCVVMLGDPWRPFGHTFYLGPIPDGQGIGAPNFGYTQAVLDALGWRICWLANPTDLYTNSPLGGTGTVLSDVEQIVLGFSASDPLGTLKLAIQQIAKLLQTDGGINLGQLGSGLLADVTGGINVAGAAVMLLPMLEGGFQGLISGIQGNGTYLPVGVAADVQAAILALKFFGGGIHGHVSYHDTTWGTGPQTYLDLGIQHASDWAAQIPVAA